MENFRAVAIVLVVAAIVAFIPTGGDAASVASRALNLAFLGVLAFGAVVLYRHQRGSLELLEPRMRAALYAAVAALAFVAAGYGKLTATSGGALVFAAIVAASVGTLLVIWQRSRDLS